MCIRDRKAIEQGEHRYERGQNYFNSLTHYAEQSKTPFRWRYKSVEGLDHNTEEMTDKAISFLIDGLDYKD